MLRLPCRKQAARANDFYLLGSLLIVALLVATTGHAATAASRRSCSSRRGTTACSWTRAPEDRRLTLNEVAM